MKHVCRHLLDQIECNLNKPFQASHGKNTYSDAIYLGFEQNMTDVLICILEIVHNQNTSRRPNLYTTLSYVSFVSTTSSK